MRRRPIDVVRPFHPIKDLMKIHESPARSSYNQTTPEITSGVSQPQEVPQLVPTLNNDVLNN